jgi:hypothetical protein
VNEAWFSRELAPFFSLFSLLAVTAVLEPLAQKGQYRSLITRLFVGLALFGGCLLLAGLVAVVSGQPRYVAAALGFTGALVGGGFVMALRDLERVYREAELRKTIAADL